MSVNMKDFDLSAMMQAADPDSETILNVDLNLIDPDLDQVRDRDSEGFNQEDIEALAQSIEELGLMQPIVLRHNPDNDERYIIVVGERRYRACCYLRDKKGGSSTILAVVRNYTNVDTAERKAQQIVENFQRKDLDTLELAKSIKRLIDYGYTVGELAQKIGLERSKVSTYLGIAELPEFIKDLYDTKQISHNYKTVYDINSAYKKDPQKAEEFINKILTTKDVFDGTDLKNLKSFVKGENDGTQYLNSIERKLSGEDEDLSVNFETEPQALDDVSSEASAENDDLTNDEIGSSESLTETDDDQELNEVDTEEHEVNVFEGDDVTDNDDSVSSQTTSSVIDESHAVEDQLSNESEENSNDESESLDLDEANKTHESNIAETLSNGNTDSSNFETESNDEEDFKPLTGFKVRYEGEICELYLNAQNPAKPDLAYIATNQNGSIVVELSELEFISNF